MRFTLLSLPLLAVAAPSILLERDATSINTAIGYINGNITKVNSTVSKLGDKDTINGFAILIQTAALEKAVSDAATTVNASAPLSDAESGSVATSVIGLEQNVFSLVDNLVAHKPQFKTVLLGGDGSFLVKANLQSSKERSDQFGAALVPKLSSNYQAAAPAIIKQIDDKFDEAIQAFS